MSTITGKCPICGKPPHPKYRPACSSQCSYIDLGRWLNGTYVVPGEEIIPVAGSGHSSEEDEY
jgi:endogenous inhibitor of DNA gyrase (YacG/DUF329 family)